MRESTGSQGWVAWPCDCVWMVHRSPPKGLFALIAQPDTTIGHEQSRSRRRSPIRKSRRVRALVLLPDVSSTMELLSLAGILSSACGWPRVATVTTTNAGVSFFELIVRQDDTNRCALSVVVIMA